MQGRGSVLIWLTYFHVGVCMFEPNLAQSANEASEFVVAMENVVKAIADKAQENHANRCDHVSNCRCSRTECSPRKNECSLPGSTCVYMINNTDCPTNKTGAPYDLVRVSLQEGYVRLPPLNLTFGSSVESEVQNTVCAQSNLDTTFAVVYNDTKLALESVNSNQSNLRSFYTTYFGAVDGSFRFYPGRDPDRSACNTYDPRIRPWYTGAISVLKDLVVLLDTGPNMRIRAIYINGKSSTPLEVAKSMTVSVMNTLTETDRATIIPFNESADAATLAGSLKTWTVPAEGLQQTEIQQFLDSASSNTASKGASNFTAGLSSALSILNNRDSSNQSLKVVILITEGNSQYAPSEQDRRTARAFQNQSIRLFVYELANEHLDQTSLWGDVCCQIDGHYQKLNTFAVARNPMSSVTSYFSVLAQSRIAANKGSRKPYWQVGYVDNSSLGIVTTITYLGIDIVLLSTLNLLQITYWIQFCTYQVVISSLSRYPSLYRRQLEHEHYYSETGFVLAAMSADVLIGVVGIDFQIAGFGSNFMANLNSYLDENDSKKIPQNLNESGVHIPNCTDNIYGDPNLSDCGSENLPDQVPVLCTRPDQVDSTATHTSLLCCDDCQSENARSTSWWGKHKVIILPVVLGPLGIALFLFLSTCTFKTLRKRRLNQQDNSPPPLEDYSFRELCEATDDFDNAKVIARRPDGVLYRARFADDSNVIAIKWLRRPADRVNDSPANIQTLDIDGHPRLVKVKGTCLGPASREEINRNIFGPSDCFLLYTSVEDGNVYRGDDDVYNMQL